MSAQGLPATSKGLVIHEVGKPLTVDDVPTPEPLPGSVVVKVLFANIDADMEHAIAGVNPFLTFPTPCILGNSAVARVAAIGPDTTSLKPGQLVLIEPHLRARDDPDGVQILFGLTHGPTPTPTGKKFMADAWRNGLFAEYARVPLENTYPLNEQVLCASPAQGGLGYELSDLPYITKQMVSMGAYSSINLKPGETIVIAPATGAFGGCSVEVAAAIGARVIACGRNAETLQRLKKNVKGNVQMYQLTGDVDKDAAGLREFGEIDAFLDFSSFAVPNGNHILSALQAIKPYGRMAFMGTLMVPTPVVFAQIVMKNLTLKGQYMYEQQDARRVIKLVEAGLLKLGGQAGFNTMVYTLPAWKEGFHVADEKKAWGNVTVMKCEE